MTLLLVAEYSNIDGLPESEVKAFLGAFLSEKERHKRYCSYKDYTEVVQWGDRMAQANDALGQEGLSLLFCLFCSSPLCNIFSSLTSYSISPPSG